MVENDMSTVLTVHGSVVLNERADAPILDVFPCTCGCEEMHDAGIALNGKQVFFCPECGLMRVKVDTTKSRW